MRSLEGGELVSGSQELPPAAARPWQECDLLTQIRRPPPSSPLPPSTNPPQATRSLSCIRLHLIPSHFFLSNLRLIRASWQIRHTKVCRYKKDANFPEGPSISVFPSKEFASIVIDQGRCQDVETISQCLRKLCRNHFAMASPTGVASPPATFLYTQVLPLEAPVDKIKPISCLKERHMRLKLFIFFHQKSGRPVSRETVIAKKWCFLSVWFYLFCSWEQRCWQWCKCTDHIIVDIVVLRRSCSVLPHIYFVCFEEIQQSLVFAAVVMRIQSRSYLFDKFYHSLSVSISCHAQKHGIVGWLTLLSSILKIQIHGFIKQNLVQWNEIQICMQSRWLRRSCRLRKSLRDDLS